ncbi:ABC transporter permease subunit [Geodermatophilus sp. YIM 151500]|uniref:ABC transporter permease n=1 Tax=Geodermatophilus sp. YIM 151500 TaxID=2984531 RepID=UPI0021E45433|nr:ABC transporter permease subunit [Geodermatophilus sp. YIM 151500]MCV2488853.1 ABC transporter permease subunit [Geodermatophilus sp. YIM 151500]
MSVPAGSGSSATEAVPLPAEPSGTPQAVPPGPTRRERGKPPAWLLRTGTGLLLLALWEAAARLLGSEFVARPTAVAAAIPEVLVTETFWQDAWATVGAVVYGVLIGAVAGMVLGLAMGRIKVVRWFFTSYVSGLYTLPMVAVVPLMTIWLGYTSETRLVAVALSAFLPIVVTTADGSRAIPKEYLDVAHTFRARLHHIWFGIALRNAIPYLIAGMQLAIARALVTAVAVEFLAGVPGLGYSILQQTRSFQQNEAFVGVILLTLFVVGARALLTLARRRFLPWYGR